MTSPGRFAVPLHRNAVVIEIGSKLTRLGFAGEPAPAAIVPSLGQVAEGRRVGVLDVGVGQAERQKALRSFFKNAYSRILLTNSKDRKVLVILNPFVSEKVEKAILDVLLVHFEVPSVAFVAPHMTVFAALGTLHTGFIIDVGNTTRLIPVCTNTAVVGAWESMPHMGFSALVKHVEQYLPKALQVVRSLINSVPDAEDTPSVVPVQATATEICHNLDMEDFTQNLIDRWIPCTISKRAKKLRNGEAYSETFKAFLDLRLHLKTGNQVHEVVVSGRFVEEIMETYFAPDTDGQNFPTQILDCILRCPVDLRTAMTQNMLVMGGLAEIRNFIPRLSAELSGLAKEEPYATRLPNASFRFISTEKIPPSIVAWKGCSILGHANYYPDYIWITREDLMLRASGSNASHLLKEWCYVGKDRRVVR